jgi:hypothetical protein
MQRRIRLILIVFGNVEIATPKKMMLGRVGSGASYASPVRY